MVPIQVVGFKNSGKTTLVRQLVKTLSSNSLRVATLKHHGHGGPPATTPNTDSEKHRQAGAVISGVEGDGFLQLNIKQDKWEMEKLLAFYRLIDIDILLIEGYKFYHFPKIVLIRGKEDLHLLEELTNIKVVYNQDCQFNPSYLCFTDQTKLIEWVADNLMVFQSENNL